MTFVLVVALAALTYASRAAALAAMPHPPPRVQEWLNRIPAPLFAGLAAISLVDAQRQVAPLPILTAVVGALVAAPRRSLLLTLAGGLAGYALGTLVW